MPNLPENLTFKTWRRSKLFERSELHGARLQSKVALTLTDSHTGHTASGDATFTLMAARDVGGLKATAIKHMAPAPFTRDAETTKFVHVDLWESDLPWRYTPRRNDPDKLPPWLVLLVGTASEIQIQGGIITSIRAEVLKQHDLGASHLWAHTQHDGHSEIARILSPRLLEAQHEYMAVLVPAFDPEGQPMWTAAGELRHVLPAFHYWRFWTAEAGDFETLATALKIPPAADVGKAKLHYRRKVPEVGLDLNIGMELRGAITSLQTEDSPDPDVLKKVKEDLEQLNNEIAGAIGLPHYGRPWLSNPDEIERGWPHDLTDDPRYRGVAGLGTWMGVEAQETLMDAAVRQSGALREAGQRVAQLAFGLWAAGRLWDRRLPSDKHERLRVLGPMMSRMVAENGGLVLNRITSSSSPLSPALFSSIAQRILRDRSPQTRHVGGANGGIDRSAALSSANEPEPQPDRSPAGPHGLPHVDVVAREMGLPPIEELFNLDDSWIAEVIDQLWDLMYWISVEYRQVRDDLLRNGQGQQIPQLRQEFADRLQHELSEQLQSRLPEREMPCEGFQIINEIGSMSPAGASGYYTRVLETDGAQSQLYAALWRALRRCMAKRPCEEIIANIDLPIQNREAFCDDLVDGLPPLPAAEQKPLKLDVLSDVLYAALDPRRPDAPAQRRLCARISGVDCTRLVPPEFAIGLDFPTWDLLRKHDKEWLLPGVGALEKDSVTALQTNPAFIDAYMVGINSQFMAEMRWRDLAVDRTCTPLRMFWGQMNYATQTRQADIQPISEWVKAPDKPVGDLTHQSIQPSDVDNTSGSRLVIAFHSELFRRYPSTLVYLVKPKLDADLDALLQKTPELEHSADGRADREFFGPIFAGAITPDVTFFAFDVTPGELDQYWLVLDEPPAELRFRNDEKKKPQNRINSAVFAESTLDQPTRVAISGKELKEQGHGP